jgi:hypothetical protein
VQRSQLARTRPPFPDLKIRFVNVLHHLAKIAHVEQRPAHRAIAKVIRLCLGDVIGIEPAIYPRRLVTRC